MSENVIELNGKRYDAVTGAYLGKSKAPVVGVLSSTPVRGKVVDGFVRPVAPAAHTKHKTPAAAPATHRAQHAGKIVAAPKPAAAPATFKPKAVVHAPAKHVPAHHPEHAKTLMRRSVHKPVMSLKPAIKPQSPAEMMAKPASALVRKQSISQVDPLRLERAARTNKHQDIARFNKDNPAAHHTAVLHVPVIPVKPAPVTIHHPPQQARGHTDIFEAAIAHATSHQQLPHKHRQHRAHRRLVNTLATVAAFLVIGGFIGYLNLPNITLHVASVQAGFQATMPGYTPTGYALQGGIKRAGGTVSMSFRSGSSSYTITQQASDWNSQTLLDNTLALSGPHATVQRNGQTIYLYGNGTNASWVSGGVRYDMTGNADLMQNDIATIAASL